MGNTKLDPRSLTSEEQALWDALAITARRNGRAAAECYSATEGAFRDLLKARRAIFGFGESASEGGKVRHCLYCEAELKPGEQHVFKGDCTQKIVHGVHAEPASEPAKVECPNCLHEDTGHAWKVNGELRYLCAGWYKPAQPEPGAAEMERPECPPNKIVPSGAAPVTKPAPAVMTEDLERVLEFAAKCHKDANTDTRVLWNPDYLVDVWKCIAAVRSQAAEAGIKLPKVRELIEASGKMADGLVAASAVERNGAVRIGLLTEATEARKFRAAADAALAELDAAEGRK